MTKKDYIMIAECIAECHNENFGINKTINYFAYRLHTHQTSSKFDAMKFKQYILEKIKPNYIPKEQAKLWSKLKSKKL